MLLSISIFEYRLRRPHNYFQRGCRFRLTTYTARCTYAPTMIRTNIWLREDHQKKLKGISEKTGAPVSALIRKAIEEYLKKQK